MPSTIHLRRKIRSITNTKQITRAMQMVAASKMRKAQDAVLGSRAYASVGYEILARLQQVLHDEAGYLHHPLLERREVQRVALVVISSDKGLAGSYNANILKKTFEFIESKSGRTIDLITIGRKASEGLSRIGRPLIASFTDFPSKPLSSDIRPIAKLTIDAFLNKEYDEVSVVYTKFYSTLRQVAEVSQVLPIETLKQAEQAEEEGVAPYLFEPRGKNILNYIVPRLVEMKLFQTVLESIASEHSARMVAMKNATENASELIDDLRLTYNSIRQADITREIAEISAGVGA